MAQAFSGKTGAGSVAVYTVPRDQTLRLALLTFTLTTDATAGVHSAVVTLFDSQLSAITARIWDWNEGGPSMTLYYTYGIGLRPFNCTVTTGMMIPNSLPETELAPQTIVTVAAVNAAGVTIAGDAISAVALYGDFASVVGNDVPEVELIPGLLPGYVVA